MGGSVLQLVAYGEQDIYLTGNPQITFFKIVYRRHTNFSMDNIKQEFDNKVTKEGGDFKSIASRKGDLISGAYIDVKLPSVTSTHDLIWTNNTGHAFVKQVEVLIGGQLIDKHQDRWLDIKQSLTDHNHRKTMLINKSKDKGPLSDSHVSGGVTELKNKQLYIPLDFWFCNETGLSLPLIALQFHEVEFKFTFRSVLGLINASKDTTTITISDNLIIDFYINFIYLDTDERRRFAQVSHEYLIEQIQVEEHDLNENVELSFKHPIKELIWVCQSSNYYEEATTSDYGSMENALYHNDTNNIYKNNYFAYSIIDKSSAATEYIGRDNKAIHYPFSDAEIFLNNVSRVEKQRTSYFAFYQHYLANHNLNNLVEHIYVYSFAIKPEETQPSGTCNFSRLRKVNLKLSNIDSKSSNNTKIIIFAINYNVLNIMSGQGGLSYY